MGDMMYIKLVVQNQEDTKESQGGKYIPGEAKQQDS